MRTLKNTFTGAGTWQQQIGGRYFRIMDAAAPVDVIFYRQGAQVVTAEQVEAGYSYAPPVGSEFDRVDVVASGAQTVKVGISDGYGTYDKTATTVTATIAKATTVSDAAPVMVGVAATALVAASAGRKAVRFYNAGTADVYLGGVGVTVANGAVKIAPGGLYLDDDAPGAAWYGISGTAGQSVRVQELI